MNKKGFILIECLVSISIISISIYIISTFLYSNYEQILSSKKSFEMLNMAKETISQIKYDIKKDDTSVKPDKYNNITNNEYEIKTIIEEHPDYQQCYKVSVIVLNDKKEVDINAYVYKE